MDYDRKKKDKDLRAFCNMKNKTHNLPTKFVIDSFHRLKTNIMYSSISRVGSD